MQDILNMVAEFHTHFGLQHRPQPSLIPADEWQLRHEIMREESSEYAEACAENDLLGIADALGDQLYVLCGTIISHGLQDRITAIVAEIHRSNMSKLDAQGKPIYRADGKVLKGPHYTPPDLRKYVED